MAIRILELHHHAVRVPPSQEAAERTRDFYRDVLGLGTDPARPDIPGVAGFWVNAGSQAQVTVIPVEPVDVIGLYVLLPRL